MKTDKFNESIRRKLESVDPDYQESAWTRLQSRLPAPVVKPMWQLRWGLTAAAASVATVLLAGSFWLYQANQQKAAAIEVLRSQVAALKKKQQPTGSAALPTPVREVDTVYITRYVEKPVYLTPDGQRPGTEEALADRVQSDRNEALSAADRDTKAETGTAPDREAVPSNPDESNGNASENRLRTGTRPDSRRVTSRSGNSLQNTAEEAGGSNRRSGDFRKNDSYAGRRTGGNQPLGPTYSTPSGTSGNRGGSGAMDSPAPSASGSEAGSAPTGLAALELMKSLPIRPDSAYFVDRYARRSRRVRFQTNPALLSKPTIEEPVPLFRVRAGLGGDLAIGQRSVGFAGEVLLGRHLVVSAGINRSVLIGGDFLTDIEFNRKTLKDFRRDYVPGIDPRHDITNIDRKTVLWQVPVSVGVRLPIGNGFTAIPSAGATFSLQADERITFTYRRGPGDFNQKLIGLRRPNDWYTTWTVAMPIEKQWDRIALQVGPLINVPFKTAPNGFNTFTGGVRARVLYQF